MDYSQNVGLPQFGASQAGPSYYYSPLNVYIFGIVDCGVEGGQLDAFVYTEGKGLKGGNNVASLLMIYLKKKGWLDEYHYAPELNILLDNCSGQNKNNMVLRLAGLLVECQYFERVNVIFWIAGHTKNAADRWYVQ